MLLGREIKKTILSITFFIFIIAFIAMPVSQDVFNFSNVVITIPGQGEDYGMQRKEVPELIIPAALASLCEEYEANEYIAYPIGFYKTVKLNDGEREKMAEIISALSGASADISYEEFKECMKRADDLIGGGSSYSEDNLLNFSYVAVTYEEAVESYNLVANADKFTGAYARLFCDYMGVILSILPVFFGVAVCLKDKRAGMCDLIFARETSSFKLIFNRYLAVIIAVMLPTVILAYISNVSVWGQYVGMTLDYFAPLKYAVGWLMPSVMIATAVGMFFTELTGTPIAIGIQGLWWFIDLNAGVVRLNGAHTLFELSPRHNTLGSTQVFLDEFNILAVNRLLFAGVSLLLVFITILVYERKRRGTFYDAGKVKKTIANLANHKSKSAA